MDQASLFQPARIRINTLLSIELPGVGALAQGVSQPRLKSGQGVQFSFPSSRKTPSCPVTGLLDESDSLPDG